MTTAKATVWLTPTFALTVRNGHTYTTVVNPVLVALVTELKRITK